MADPSPTNLAEASRLLRDAATAAIDGPGAFLGEALDRAGQVGYDADDAVADAAGYGVRVLQAWFGGLTALADAATLAAAPRQEAHRFSVAVPPAPVLRTVTITARRWTWLLEAEPVGIALRLRTVAPLAADATRVDLRASPLVAEPSWDVDLLLSPVVSGGPVAATTVTASLDLVTEIPPGDPWPPGP